MDKVSDDVFAELNAEVNEEEIKRATEIKLAKSSVGNASVSDGTTFTLPVVMSSGKVLPGVASLTVSQLATLVIEGEVLKKWIDTGIEYANALQRTGQADFSEHGLSQSKVRSPRVLDPDIYRTPEDVMRLYAELGMPTSKTIKDPEPIGITEAEKFLGKGALDPYCKKNPSLPKLVPQGVSGVVEK